MAAEISGLGFNSTGYVAVKAINLIGIYGPISDSISESQLNSRHRRSIKSNRIWKDFYKQY